ncbi:MAG: hypothetical protein ACI861_000321 [Paracoccaceae bacterium]|jgi:hypothetical protein
MTPLLNWLVLIAFAAASILFARWVVNQSLARWTGPKTIASFAFLYTMTIAAIGGLTFAALSVLYQKILYQPHFIELVGVTGTLKFLLMFSGVWYAMLYMIQSKEDPEP